MCDVCHMSRCPAGCPNALDPPEVFTCKHCKEPIRAGEEYLEVDGDYFHLEDCASDAALPLLLDRFGARQGVAGEADKW